MKLDKKERTPLLRVLNGEFTAKQNLYRMIGSVQVFLAFTHFDRLFTTECVNCVDTEIEMTNYA